MNFKSSYIEQVYFVKLRSR